MVKILDPLREASNGLASAFIVAGGVIGEDQEVLGGEIVGNIHVAILSATSETISDDHETLRLVLSLVRILSGIPVSSQFLIVLGPEDATLHPQAGEVSERITHPSGSVIPFSEGVFIYQNGSPRQNDCHSKNRYYSKARRARLHLHLGFDPPGFSDILIT
ncbi:hypothetical protein [Bifidobacterium polysaccharolyticum]|uniref:Uncharacterized protein n=1 Tax=Bifidobacterium polysaccharolyticum TaxID=2750967 RepID=A0ABS0QX21_9BIFI|nr:hypothetical protein [Bifidobacterium polysaccharolyticum]MBI0106446.1 hypothetical protein [Bifidobacterium polysaccharolyticum]